MKRRDFLKGITAIGAISAAPKLIASEPKAYYGTTDLTEESLGQLLDEIGDEPIAYNWSEVYVNETGFHTVLKVECWGRFI